MWLGVVNRNFTYNQIGTDRVRGAMWSKGVLNTNCIKMDLGTSPIEEKLVLTNSKMLALGVIRRHGAIPALGTKQTNGEIKINGVINRSLILHGQINNGKLNLIIMNGNIDCKNY